MSIEWEQDFEFPHSEQIMGLFLVRITRKHCFTLLFAWKVVSVILQDNGVLVVTPINVLFPVFLDKPDEFFDRNFLPIAGPAVVSLHVRNGEPT